MKLINRGPNAYHGTAKRQLPGTKGSETILIPVDQVVEVDDETGARLLADFKGSAMFGFERMTPIDTSNAVTTGDADAEKDKRGPGRPKKDTR